MSETLPAPTETIEAAQAEPVANPLDAALELILREMSAIHAEFAPKTEDHYLSVTVEINGCNGQSKGIRISAPDSFDGFEASSFASARKLIADAVLMPSRRVQKLIEKRTALDAEIATLQAKGQLLITN